MKHRGRPNVYDMIHPPAIRPQLVPKRRRTRRQPPDHLGECERQIWAHVLADFELTTETAIDVLVSGLEAHMRCREARQRIDEDGMVQTGRDGQQKPHVLLSVERDARAAWLAAVKALGLQL
jgi:P27 family predicted phage terminase small subunit